MASFVQAPQQAAGGAEFWGAVFAGRGWAGVGSPTGVDQLGVADLKLRQVFGGQLVLALGSGLVGGAVAGPKGLDQVGGPGLGGVAVSDRDQLTQVVGIAQRVRGVVAAVGKEPVVDGGPGEGGQHAQVGHRLAPRQA